MKVFTTINPYGNFDAQKEAILSWCKSYEVYSVNSEDEINMAKDIYPEVNFIKTENTYQIGSKNLIKLNGILDAIKTTDAKKCAIVNSDIILKDRINIGKRLDGSLTMATRWEIGDVPPHPFPSGYDLFIFDFKDIGLFYNKNYVIGMPWWDFWMPIIANKFGIKVFHIKNDAILHRTHETNYDQKAWNRFASLFYSDIKILGGNWKVDDEFTKDPDRYLVESGAFCTAIKRFIESIQIDIKSK